MSFAEKLKLLLTKNNMRAADLARCTQLSEAAISDYIKGKKEPRGKQSIAIAKALNVSLDELWDTDFKDSTLNNKKLSFSTEEHEILNKYRQLDIYGKKVVKSVLDAEFERLENLSEVDNKNE